MSAVAITDRTRKLLWARAGGRCAKCRRPLIEDATELDDDAIIGEECHIVSPAPSGPRRGSERPGGYDHVDNLLLLCRNCHREVDAQPRTFSLEALRRMRDEHIEWVASRLIDHPGDFRWALTPLSDRVALDLIPSGEQLARFVDRAHDFAWDTTPRSATTTRTSSLGRWTH